MDWSYDIRNLKNADLMGGKTDAVIHVSLGDKEMKTKVVELFLFGENEGGRYLYSMS